MGDVFFVLIVTVVARSENQSRPLRSIIMATDAISSLKARRERNFVSTLITPLRIPLC